MIKNAINLNNYSQLAIINHKRKENATNMEAMNILNPLWLIKIKIMKLLDRFLKNYPKNRYKQNIIIIKIKIRIVKNLCNIFSDIIILKFIFDYLYVI